MPQRRRIKDKHLGYFFVLPAFLMLFVVLIFPAISTLSYSLTPQWVRGPTKYTLTNYFGLTQDRVFLFTFKNTLIFVAISVLFHLLLGLGIALLINMKIKGRILFRVIALLPWTVPDVVSGIIWRWMYNPLLGCLNDLLFRLHLIDRAWEWLSSPSLALPSVIFSNVWRGYPFVMLILLAGLQSIPEELYEAASIDGATTFKKFWYVTLPGLKRMIIVALALDTVWEFRRFGLVKVMTEGGPGYATEVLPTLVYKTYFKFFRFEYASAMAVVLSIVLLFVSLPYIKMIMKEE